MSIINKILFPVDFSNECVGAARYVEAVAGRFESEVTLLHVVCPGEHTLADELLPKRQAQLSAFLADELKYFATQRVCVTGDDPALAIEQAARTRKPDLIMMPTHGLGAFRRLLLGSVTAKVLHDVRCPVWTSVHAEAAPRLENIHCRRILCTVDLNERSQSVLDWAASIAAEYEAALGIVHATPELSATYASLSVEQEFEQTVSAEATKAYRRPPDSRGHGRDSIRPCRRTSRSDFVLRQGVCGRSPGNGQAQRRGACRIPPPERLRHTPRFAVPGHQHIAAAFLLLSSTVASCAAADVKEIATRAAAVLRSDWAAAPEYAFVQRDEFQRDEFQRDGKPASKTHEVVMIAGSDYYMPVAIDDRPLPPEQRQSELRKLQEEARRRNNEDPAARQKRIQNYRKQREQNGEMTVEFPKAFHFELAGEETIDGWPAWVLAATPVKRVGTLSRVAKVLAGMRGRIWVEKESFQVIRAEASVFTPVSIFGIFARVLPGTRMELEMRPVTDSIWLAGRFSLNLELSRVWSRSTQATSSTYYDYRPNGHVLTDLLSTDLLSEISR